MDLEEQRIFFGGSFFSKLMPTFSGNSQIDAKIPALPKPCQGLAKTVAAKSA